MISVLLWIAAFGVAAYLVLKALGEQRIIRERGVRDD
jgi:hypothetical protein